MKSPRLTEHDLAIFEANMRKIKVGQPGPARAVADSQGAGLDSKVLTVTASPYKSNVMVDQLKQPKRPALYRSKWESAYASKLEMEKRAGHIKAYWYEPFSLWLPGKVRYKPDFLIQYPDGMEQRVEIIEVKGWSKNRRDGMTRLKIAAAIYSCFVWKMVYRTKYGGWDGIYVG